LILINRENTDSAADNRLSWFAIHVEKELLRSVGPEHELLLSGCTLKESPGPLGNQKSAVDPESKTVQHGSTIGQ
jgi:hypothetical protein